MTVDATFLRLVSLCESYPGFKNPGLEDETPLEFKKRGDFHVFDFPVAERSLRS